MDDHKDLIETPINQELDTQQENEDLKIEFRLDNRRDEREVAFNLVYAVDRSSYDIDLSEVLLNFERGFHLAVPDDSFALKLSQGTISCRKEIDEQIKPHLKNWKLERLGCCTKLILRMALWELSQKDAITSVVINEAVELAKKFAEKDSYKFVNGILDEICKSSKEGSKDGNEEQQKK